MTFDYRLRRGPFDPPPDNPQPGSIIRLLGPYAITSDTPDLVSGAIVADLPDNTLIIRVSIFITTSWGLTTFSALVANAAIDEASDNLLVIATSTANPVATSHIQETFNVARSELPTDADIPLVLTKTGAKLVVFASEEPANGAADIYVLTAEVAA